MKKVHCPECMMSDVIFIRSICADDGGICGDHMECSRCGKKFIIVYDESKIPEQYSSMTKIKHDKKGLQ
jgi:transcriptional regulator NrdR family protein